MNWSEMFFNTILPNFFLQSVTNLSGMFCNKILPKMFWIWNILQYVYWNLSQIYQECFTIECCQKFVESQIHQKWFLIKFCKAFFESVPNLSGMFCNKILLNVFWICHKPSEMFLIKFCPTFLNLSWMCHKCFVIRLCTIFF